MPSSLNFSMSRLQPSASAMGSLASDAPPKGCQFAVYYWYLSTLTGLVVNTTDVETLVALPEGCLEVSNSFPGVSQAFSATHHCPSR